MPVSRSSDARLFLITDVDPAVVQRLLLVAVLLCGGRLSGDPEIGGTQVFTGSKKSSLPRSCRVRTGQGYPRGLQGIFQYGTHRMSAGPSSRNLSGSSFLKKAEGRFKMMFRP